ncbi:MAG TPA: alpha/beta fold hydrolase [Oleiagrimonas sp.]|nr:alpha/beta fold hydrolase [Oleiagrimonas sp.]
MAFKNRTWLRLLVLVVVAAFLVWQWWRYPPSSPPDASAAAPASAMTASVAAATSTATWQRGSLTLHPCTIGGAAEGGRGASVEAWCKRFDVPEDRSHPQGRHIQLHLAVIRAESENPVSDMVVFLAGGPGEAATHKAFLVAAFPKLHQHHDFLLLDQRGTGKSNPLSCKTESDAKGMPGTFDAEQLRRQAKACLEQVQKRADPRFYTTTAAVADLEAVREALGSPKFDLIGTSYGTRMALQYLRAHPEGVRSVVLDSPVPNQVVLGQDFARSLQDALVKDFALCTNDPACRKRFGDPMHSLKLLRHALAANPHMVNTRNPWSYKPEKQALTAQTLASVVRLFAYSRATIQLLPLTIDAAAHGDVGPLLGQYALLKESLSGRHLNQGMNWSVICAEDADMMQPRKADADTLLGNRMVKTYAAICSVWPSGKRPANFHQPDTSDKPVLILSGALDPVTPPAYGQMVLKHLGNARQIVFKGQAHGLITVGCARNLMSQFILSGQSDKLDTACMKPMAPPAPFINFNGAAP